MATTDPPTIRPFLMFSGRAEEAMNLYVSVFEGSAILDVTPWASGEPGGTEGKVKLAHFALLNNQIVIKCADGPAEHAAAFSTASSLFVTCRNEDEVTKYCDALSKNGKFHMPLGSYGFSTKFAWVEDEFGVSWQINLP